MHNYHTENGCFPPAYIADENGRPMHSWRVLLLPYLDQAALYRRYRFDEPWNGPNNRKLADIALRVYNCPSNFKSASTTTSYVVVVGPNTLFPGAECTKAEDVTDGLEKTIMLVEMSDSGIHWMEPRDLHMVQMKASFNASPGRGISSHHKGTVNIGFADGRARSVQKNVNADTIRALLTINGGEDLTDW